MAVPDDRRANAYGAIDREQCGRLALEIRRLLLSDFSSRRDIARAIERLPGFSGYLYERVRGGRIQARPELADQEAEHLPSGSPEWVLWKFGARVVESCLLDFLRGRPWSA